MQSNSAHWSRFGKCKVRGLRFHDIERWAGAMLETIFNIYIMVQKGKRYTPKVTVKRTNATAGGRIMVKTNAPVVKAK